jgi:hypothetical protein
VMLTHISLGPARPAIDSVSLAGDAPVIVPFWLR